MTKRVLYEEDFVQLDNTRLTITWVEPTVITVDTDGDVLIRQNDDLVLIPWPYVRDVIKALEDATHE